MKFQRTDSGLIGKYLFYREPLVWVEGRADIPFYERIVRDFPCRFEDAGGKPECQKLAAEVARNDYPYVVILDGDYDLLEKTCSNHRRVILLHRHSTENYLFEKRPLEQVCRNYAQAGTDEDLLGSAFEDLLECTKCELLDLIVLDVAHYRAATGHKVLTGQIRRMLESTKKITSSRDSIGKHCAECRIILGQQTLDEVKDLVSRYLERRRLVDLMPGHLAFSMLRNLITNAVKRKRKRKPHIDNDGLLILLSSEVWSSVETSDHRSLRRRLRQAVKEAQKKREDI